MSLNEQILEAIQGCTAGDYCQRSALGMARTWVDKRKPVDRPVKYGDGDWQVRDDLAEELVGIMEANPADRLDYIQALGEARAWVNAPFVDPTMQGQKTGKAILKPKDSKGK